MLTYRPRRLRTNPLIREMVSETIFSKDMLVYPLFLVPGTAHQSLIPSLADQFHFSVDQAVIEIEKYLHKGLNKFLLFGSGEPKHDDARTAYSENSVVNQGIKALKSRFGKDIYLISDICACAYTPHGHCGIVIGELIDNDLSLAILGKIALSNAASGVDMVAPSDMMDGRVGYIRKLLDQENYGSTGIMSYSIKYASTYYGPFREASGSAPEFGDRKTYQMDFRNPKESLKEAALDEQEGADILMVKPALAYLDIIQSLSQATNLPVACYNVSGEYAMVKAVVKSGLINEKNLVMENMIAFSRAGAKIIISYHARDIILNNWIQS